MRNQFLGSLIFAFVFLLAQTNIAIGSKVVYCYWGTWAHYRPGDGNFEASNIDPNLCTHIGYAFMGLDENGEIKSLDSFLDFDLNNIAKTVALKKINPNLKVLASIGGWNEGSIKYSKMASTSASRARFIKSVIDFLLKWFLDGCDMDWEYPTQREGSPDDYVNFVTLLKELNIALKAHNLLLTIAVGAGIKIATASYDIPNISKHVDLINVMTYDFPGPGVTTAQLNAPLEGNGNNDVESSINFWLKSGAPHNKIVLGLPLYGRSYTLANSTKNTPGSPVTGVGLAGPITQEAGTLGYNEICKDLKSGWTRRWDASELVPYAYSGNQWVGYDDVESISLKVNYLKCLNLAGAMVWSIETDDFRGNCGEKYPLMKAINRGLKSHGRFANLTRRLREWFFGVQ